MPEARASGAKCQEPRTGAPLTSPLVSWAHPDKMMLGSASLPVLSVSSESSVAAAGSAMLGRTCTMGGRAACQSLPTHRCLRAFCDCNAF